jgi:hypothetical protein
MMWFEVGYVYDLVRARRRRRAIEQARAELVRKGADPRSQHLTEKATRLVDRRVDRACRRKKSRGSVRA